MRCAYSCRWKEARIEQEPSDCREVERASEKSADRRAMEEVRHFGSLFRAKQYLLLSLVDFEFNITVTNPTKK